MAISLQKLHLPWKLFCLPRDLLEADNIPPDYRDGPLCDTE